MAYNGFAFAPGWRRGNYIPIASGDAPVNTDPPVITGDLTEFRTLSVTTGTWTNSPSGYSYQWDADDVPIDGATASTYDLTDDDDGAMIGCTVTAANGSGSASADATPVGPIGMSGLDFSNPDNSGLI